MVSDDLLGFAATRYGFDRNTLRFVAAGREKSRQFYSFVRDGKEYILRLEMDGVSRVGQTKAEMDWLLYLSGKGVSVSVPLKTRDGELAVLSEKTGESCLISACGRVAGRKWDVNDPALWNERIFHSWGKTMGDIHRVTKDYRPAAGLERRPEFASIILDTVKAFPSVNRAAEAVLREIAALPRDRDSYGLIHYDLNPANFMIDGEWIHVYDFADCSYGWFALDIGCALAVGLWLGRRNDAGYDFTDDIIRNFLRGYLSANALNDFWLSKIPLFMRLCQIAGFSCAYTHEDPEDKQQNEQISNIENHIFMTGHTIDESWFIANIK